MRQKLQNLTNLPILEIQNNKIANLNLIIQKNENHHFYKKIFFIIKNEKVETNMWQNFIDCLKKSLEFKIFTCEVDQFNGVYYEF